MAISKEELIKKIDDWRKDKNINLSDDYLEYLDGYITPKNISVFAVDDDTGKELDNYTPEFETAQAKVLDDLGLSDSEIDEIMGNTASSDNTPDDDESLIIGGTDIYKTPFTEKQLAILRGDDDYRKFSKDEFDALQAADIPKARTARKAWIKRARELLDSTPDDPDELSDKPHDEELAGKQPLKNDGLAGETTPEEKEMLNITNRLAKNLSKHRW